MAKRNYPNDYYAWYNDDDRIAILERVTSTDSSQTHREVWDTFQSSGDLSGTITSSSTSSTIQFNCSASHGLATNDRVTISGTTSYDGNYAITYVDADSFTIAGSNSGSSETGTWTSLFVDNGIRLTYHSKYSPVSAVTDDLKTSSGLDSGMHHALVNYVKCRLFQDMGDIQQAEYYRKLFEEIFKKYPSRKSGIRCLSVPRI